MLDKDKDRERDSDRERIILQDINKFKTNLFNISDNIRDLKITFNFQ